MHLDRRQLFQKFGVVAAATAVLPSPLESAAAGTDVSASLVRLNRNESAYGPCEKAKAAFHQAVTEANRYPCQDVEDLRATVAALHRVRSENITLG